VFYRNKTHLNISKEDVIVYNNEYVLKNNLWTAFYNQTVNVIKLFFQTIRETMMMIEKFTDQKEPKYSLMF
jgi:integrase/recombinase XerD